MVRERRASGQTLALLAALISQPRAWRHGYELACETGLKSGTLYPILMRLEQRALLEAKWEDAALAGRPPRHLYRLTAQGVVWTREQLAAEAELALPQRGRA